MDWRDKAACLTVDPELFFPVGNTGPAVDQIEKAKTVCATCTVTEICLQYALESSQDSGVWGGLSEDERRALKRPAARARRAPFISRTGPSTCDLPASVCVEVAQGCSQRSGMSMTTSVPSPSAPRHSIVPPSSPWMSVRMI